MAPEGFGSQLCSVLGQGEGLPKAESPCFSISETQPSNFLYSI